MTHYIMRRLLSFTLVLIGVSIIIFFVLHILPGDPAQIILGTQATPEKLANLRHLMGLDRPIIVQYFDWLKGVFTGDLGHSISYDTSVASLIGTRMEVTLFLTFFAIFLSVIIGIPLGIFAATHQGTPGDYLVMLFSQIGIAVPAFWTGILFIYFFAVKFHIFPAGGFIPFSKGLIPFLRSLILPTLSIAIVRASVLARMSRSSVLEVMREDYVRTARSKGLSERVVIYKHVLKNAFIPILTVIGLQIGQLMAGEIVIENVFYLPGLGQLVMRSIGQRDLPTVQAIVLFIAVLIILINLVVDILYGYFDPRIKYE